MMGHKICFYGEIWLIFPKLSLLPLLKWSIACMAAVCSDPHPSNDNMCSKVYFPVLHLIHLNIQIHLKMTGVS